MIIHTWRNVRDRLIRSGRVTEDDIDQARAEMDWEAERETVEQGLREWGLRNVHDVIAEVAPETCAAGVGGGEICWLPRGHAGDHEPDA